MSEAIDWSKRHCTENLSKEEIARLVQAVDEWWIEVGEEIEAEKAAQQPSLLPPKPDDAAPKDEGGAG